MTKLNEISTAVENGKTKLVAGLVQEAVDEGFKAAEILDSMVSAMGVVGDNFSKGEIFVPEMLMAAKAMNKGVEVIQPLLAGEGAESLGKCIIGTVEGDLHDIGKNLVTLMIGAAGFDMIDLGVDVSTDKFIAAVKENPDVKIVALSALLTTTMPAMQETAKALNEIKGDYNYKLMVGGAPITKEFADSIGADGWAPDAGAAALEAKSLIA